MAQIIEFKINTFEELDACALKVKELIPEHGQVMFALSGDLGAGKTTFVGALLKQMGVVESVSSPTFVLEHRYQTPTGFVIEHWDLYRLTEVPLELLEPVSSKVIRLVEWADKFPEIWDTSNYQLTFTFDSTASQRRLQMVMDTHKVRLD